MNIAQMIRDGEPAVAAAVAALVEQLRQQFPGTVYHRDQLHRDAADEIERLRAELAALRAQKPVARAEQVGEQVVARWLTSDHAMVCPAGTLLYAAPAAAAPAGWQLVPVEPTIAGDGARVNVDDATRTPAIYRAMPTETRALVDPAIQPDLWRCTVCGRTGTVGRCCGEETREPVRAPNA